MASDWGLYYISPTTHILLSKRTASRATTRENGGVTGAGLAQIATTCHSTAAGENARSTASGPSACAAPTTPVQLPEGHAVEEQTASSATVQAQIAETNRSCRGEAADLSLHALREMSRSTRERRQVRRARERDPHLPDDNDGRIRALPKEPNKWKHGVYYTSPISGRR
jgi:hypothetical protein